MVVKIDGKRMRLRKEVVEALKEVGKVFLCGIVCAVLAIAMLCAWVDWHYNVLENGSITARGEEVEVGR